MPREMQEADLVLSHDVLPAQQRKLQPNWEGPYFIFQKLPHGAYKLEEMDGQLIPINWNSIRLKYYYSQVICKSWGTNHSPMYESLNIY